MEACHGRVAYRLRHRVLYLVFRAVRCCVVFCDVCLTVYPAFCRVYRTFYRTITLSSTGSTLCRTVYGTICCPFTVCCSGQVTWIQGQKGDAKKAGILAAVAKVPTLLKKLEAAAHAAVGSKGKEEVTQV